MLLGSFGCITLLIIAYAVIAVLSCIRVLVFSGNSIVALFAVVSCDGKQLLMFAVIIVVSCVEFVVSISDRGVAWFIFEFPLFKILLFPLNKCVCVCEHRSVTWFKCLKKIQYGKGEQ